MVFVISFCIVSRSVIHAYEHAVHGFGAADLALLSHKSCLTPLDGFFLKVQ